MTNTLPLDELICKNQTLGKHFDLFLDVDRNATKTYLYVQADILFVNLSTFPGSTNSISISSNFGFSSGTNSISEQQQKYRF